MRTGIAAVVTSLALPSIAVGAPADYRGALPIRECPTAALSLPERTEEAMAATLLVRADDATGSAVLISADGFALTAAHVIGDAPSVTVVSSGGKRLRADVVRVDARQDVALLKVHASGDTPCLAPQSGEAPIGSEVFVLGSPGGEELSFSVAKGIVSGHRTFSGLDFVQLDASVNPGNSGGPAVDEHGRVVGIASWKVSHVAMEGLAFAVPIAVALASLELELGDASATDWRDRGGRRPAPDSSAPSRRGPRATATDDELRRVGERRRRARLSTDLFVAGGSLAGAGLITVAATSGAYYRGTRMGPGEWKTAVAFNALGWALTGVGAALVGAGFLVRKAPRAKRVAMFTHGGGLGGRF